MLEFSPLERKIYDSLYSNAKKNFDRLTERGLVSKNYTHILAMLMRYESFALITDILITTVTKQFATSRASS